jgi:Mn-dependent DtxR family transcriptional regulator
MEHLAVTSPSVNGALKKLKGLDFVNFEAYGYVELTPTGRKEAEKILRRHQLLTRFLTGILGVDKEVAERDACIMEHGISSETQQRLRRFLREIEGEHENGKSPKE